MDLHVKFLLNSGYAYLSDLNVFKWHLWISGVPRASWDSFWDPQVSSCGTPFPIWQFNNISDTWEYKWTLFKRKGCQKKCGFRYRTENLQLGLCFWLHHCPFLDMTPSLPWLGCLIHKMKARILVLFVQCPNQERSCGTAELSWLSDGWVTFAEASIFSKAWANRNNSWTTREVTGSGAVFVNNGRGILLMWPIHLTKTYSLHHFLKPMDCKYCSLLNYLRDESMQFKIQLLNYWIPFSQTLIWTAPSCWMSRFTLTPTGNCLCKLGLRTGSNMVERNPVLQGSWAIWLLLQAVPHQVLPLAVKLG